MKSRQGERVVLFDITLGRRLRRLRERLEMSQGGLADALGCTQGSVSNYETGKRTIPSYTLALWVSFLRSRGVEPTICDLIDEAWKAATE